MNVPFWRHKQDEQLQQELESHLRMAASDRMERGQTPADAHAAARREFGNLGLVTEVTREMWGWASLERLLQDVRYGARVLAKSPGFSLVAILTLALGIGATTALFSVVNAVLLTTLPYPHPEQLVTLHMSKPNFAQGAISYPNFKDWQAQNHTFSAMALSRVGAMNIIGGGEPEHLRINFITADFFPLLGVKPVLGRHLAAGEDDIGGPALVEISEGLWKRRFGASPDVLGKTLNLTGKPYTIIGVVPAGFDLLLSNFRPTDIYLPLGQWQNGGLRVRGAALGLHGIGRLKDGVTLQQARADMATVSRDLAAAFPNTNKDNTSNLVPLKTSMVGDVQSVLLMLLGAVTFVLLIACVNVANLLLARSEARTREFAVRSALGASRARMLRQLLTESVLLSVVGGGIGMLLASWITRAALAALPRPLPRGDQAHLDGRVLLFSLAASLAAGILFGLVPALRGASRDVHHRLQSANRRTTGQGSRPQRALVVIEIAMAMVLLVGAGLMLRSVVRLWRVDPGFDPHNLMMLGVSLPPSAVSAPPAQVRSTLRSISAAMAGIPGVRAASFSDASMPLLGDDELVFWLAGHPKPKTDSAANWALRYIVQPSYRDVMKLPLLRGRFLGVQDTEKTPPVVVVDDVFAAKFFPGQDPIGQRIAWTNNGQPVEPQIVGVVGHVKQWGLDSDDKNTLRAELYVSFDQYSDADLPLQNTGMLVRTSGSPLAFFNAMKRSVRQVNSEIVLYSPTPFADTIEGSLSMRHFSMVLLAGFAGLALLLAAIGLFGVIAYLVGQRTQEFGIRMALGAQPRDVLMMVMKAGGVLVLVGIVVGQAAALGLTRLLTQLLFGVRPTDPLTFAAVSVLLIAVALLACYLPARRAVRVDPTIALRYE